MLSALLSYVLAHPVEVTGGVVGAASLVANFIAPTSSVGKVLHFLALNGPQIQAAVNAWKEEPVTGADPKPATDPQGKPVPGVREI